MCELNVNREHVCSNYKGSSGNMEAVGAFKIFEKSSNETCNTPSTMVMNYYGIAIRSNVGCLEKMESAVIAAFFHCCSSNQNPMHGQCPTGKDSWCKYKQALHDDKASNAFESRFDLIGTDSNYFQFLYNICDLKDTPPNDELKYCKDLKAVLTDGNLSDINALDLAMVAVLALLNKKGSNRDFKILIEPGFCSESRYSFKVIAYSPNKCGMWKRSFSKLKLIKKFLRSLTTEDRLNGLTTIAIEHEPAEEINVKEIIKKNLRIKSEKETLLRV
ncbi:uncharacterized protein TNCV_3535901 [Trichonephila clavipes]|uniref:Uncharacterized protein n=1 Tax=Trichonephila clavipes TaxID=2585209 RepID=A0A8X6VWQ9_TRICX|nr:uncharacterized protein TNCV_3535901 [Trichonephila clavipes]